MSNVTLVPTDTSIVTSFGTIKGAWQSDGVSTPVGALLWLNHSNGAPDLQWSMINANTNVTLIPQQTLTAAQSDALATGTDADGYKQIPLRVINPSYGAQPAGEFVWFQTSAPSRWQAKTGPTTSGFYYLTPVPEPVTLGVVAALFAVVAGRLLRRAY